MNPNFDAATFRNVLGHYPTGVCAVTSLAGDRPVGMIVGSFTSVSLEPPLVAFFPDRRSTTWPEIRAARRFCVNVLAADQHDVCRTLSARLADKFADLDWSPSASGLPVVAAAVAWIDCDLDAVHPAGDHDIVVGHVRDLAVARTEPPMVFCQGRYGRVDFAQAGPVAAIGTRVTTG